MADIVDTAVNAGSFQTLVRAIQAAGLVDTLKSPGSFTVFAPTDEAFGKLPAGTIDSLLGDIPALKQILTYHVVSDRAIASDLIKLNSVTTVEGSKLKIDASEGNLKVGNAKVITPDLAADNGVIHAIDTVLLPE
ncbi:MAG TPA: fasciclin [Cyanobacteria bacterium UBA11369]|nr:fasciclin [Cyanobacteria bacterium UBA11371]HBE35765.1 fasciclin [Cyanobacteria bacterium UBA11368]HBE49476.1 fasciclin [Cyanobacteria bacterium UBA11369]